VSKSWSLVSDEGFASTLVPTLLVTAGYINYFLPLTMAFERKTSTDRVPEGVHGPRSPVAPLGRMDYQTAQLSRFGGPPPAPAFF
jgi:hypothetical protein